MANNYYDATGVLVLDRVTPVITALFGRYRLDPAHPGDGQAYIARISETRTPQWCDVLLDLVALAATLDLPAPGYDAREGEDGLEGSDDLAIEAMLDLLAGHFRAEGNADLLNLIEHHAFDGEADLEALFLIATCFDDGHHLAAMLFEGCWHCSRPRLFEFGGDSCFLSREVRLLGNSTSALQLGEGLRKAILANDAGAAAALIAKEAQALLGGIFDDHFRMRVVQRVAARLLEGPASIPDPA
ncbi:hypothetical protein YS110_06095 [Acidovorax sp. YS12]|nr:hypothetical protein YS110_06095 [Acidovorax sp. YS12]